MKNLTEGSTGKLLISFTIPVLFGILFQQFYFTVDLMIVGKFVGATALAAVGTTNSVSFLVLGLCNGLCVGFAIPVSQKFGQKDMEGLRRFVANIVWLCLIFSIVITVPVTIFAGNILRLMRVPEETFELALQYMRVIFIGIPATLLYNIEASVLRALGDSRLPLYFLIFSSVLNIGLDLALILWAHMGVAGAAVATVVSQLISGILCLLVILRRYRVLHPGKKEWGIRKAECVRLLSMGLPTGLQFSVTAIGSILLQSSVNVLGSDYMAAFSAGERIRCLFCCFFDAQAGAAATFTGQNVGAGKLDRVHAATRWNMGIAMIFSAVSFGAICFLGRPMLSMFLDQEDPMMDRILEYGQKLLLINGASFPLLASVNVIRSNIQGMGYSSLSVCSGIMELAGRSAVAMYLVPRIGFTAACIAGPAAWLLANMFLYPAYFIRLRQMEKRRDRLKAFEKLSSAADEE